MNFLFSIDVYTFHTSNNEILKGHRRDTKEAIASSPPTVIHDPEK